MEMTMSNGGKPVHDKRKLLGPPVLEGEQSESTLTSAETQDEFQSFSRRSPQQDDLNRRSFLRKTKRRTNVRVMESFRKHLSSARHVFAPSTAKPSSSAEEESAENKTDDSPYDGKGWMSALDLRKTGRCISRKDIGQEAKKATDPSYAAQLTLPSESRKSLRVVWMEAFAWSKRKFLHDDRDRQQSGSTIPSCDGEIQKGQGTEPASSPAQEMVKEETPEKPSKISALDKFTPSVDSVSIGQDTREASISRSDCAGVSQESSTKKRKKSIFRIRTWSKAPSKGKHEF